MNVINGLRQTSYGDISLSTIMLYDVMVTKIMNSEKFDNPAPLLRHTVFNTNYTIGPPLVCSCTSAEKQIPYKALPQVISTGFEHAVSDGLMKQIHEILKF